MTNIFEVLKDYTSYFDSDTIPDYEFLRLSKTHRKFDALMRRFWDSMHPLTKDIVISFIYEIKSLFVRLEQLENDIELKDNMIAKLRKEANERGEYLQALVEKMESEVQNTLFLTEEEIKMLEEESRKKSEIVEQLQAEIMVLKSELNSQSNLSSDAVTEAIILQQKISSLESDIKNYKETIERLTLDNLQLLEQNVGLQRNSDKLLQRLDLLEKENSQLKEQKKLLQNHIEEKIQEMEKLETIIQELRAGGAVEAIPLESEESLASIYGKQSTDPLKTDLQQLSKAVKQEFKGKFEPTTPKKPKESPLKHLVEKIQENARPISLFQLGSILDSIDDANNEVVKLLKTIVSNTIQSILETDLEQLKREHLMEKIQLQSEIVQLRNKLIEITSSTDLPRTIHSEIVKQFDHAKMDDLEEHQRKLAQHDVALQANTDAMGTFNASEKTDSETDYSTNINQTKGSSDEPKLERHTLEPEIKNLSSQLEEEPETTASSLESIDSVPSKVQSTAEEEPKTKSSLVKEIEAELLADVPPEIDPDLDIEVIVEEENEGDDEKTSKLLNKFHEKLKEDKGFLSD